ncbi:hypothetical protein IEQ34_020372 [Dendrobium chrysotoxum]|uniref:RING-type E3 ubiquitin transferase n=1 Tax=Dendrobium chrysotoxum TaxID=161865 RepID=A0AAV7G0Q9_DENCH|nr:hypothetical protein IEQ34_020372 [Dendrobium chrysotoxum]
MTTTAGKMSIYGIWLNKRANGGLRQQIYGILVNKRANGGRRQHILEIRLNKRVNSRRLTEPKLQEAGKNLSEECKRTVAKDRTHQSPGSGVTCEPQEANEGGSRSSVRTPIQGLGSPPSPSPPSRSFAFSIPNRFEARLLLLIVRYELLLFDSSACPAFEVPPTLVKRSQMSFNRTEHRVARPTIHDLMAYGFHISHTVCVLVPYTDFRSSSIHISATRTLNPLTGAVVDPAPLLETIAAAELEGSGAVSAEVEQSSNDEGAINAGEGDGRKATIGSAERSNFQGRGGILREKWDPGTMGTGAWWSRVAIKREHLKKEIRHLLKFKFERTGCFEKLGEISKYSGGVMTKCGDPHNENSLSYENAECCICLSPYDDGVELRQLRCGHHFHCSCIDKWLHINATCHLCKYNIIKNSNSSREEA